MNALTLGFFDGVHTGHLHLLQQLRTAAAQRGLRSVALTFDVPPRSVVQPDYQPSLLSTTTEKVALLSQSGIDEVIVMPFTRDLARLTAQEFLQQVLREQYDTDFLLMGYDHRFGSNGKAPFADYLRWGQEVGIEIQQAQPLYNADALPVSSSLVRRYLMAGDILTVQELLGRRYTLTGEVVKGRQVGRTIGFPTANLALPPHLLRPDLGIYACWATVEEGRFPAMVNIGQRPTLNNGFDITIEAHLIDFAADLYGKHVTLEFLARLRSEMKFDGLPALQAQIEKDRCETLRIIESPALAAQRSNKAP